MSILKDPVTSDDHTQGDKHAAITLVEYGDFECIHCKNAYFVIKKIQQYFDKQLRFVFRHFPLTEVHPYAEIAAETTEFASIHERFWEMHDLIYEKQDNLSGPMLLEDLEVLNLPAADLEKVLEKKIYEPKIRKDFIGGVRSGVNGTPTLFINEHRYNGAVEFDELKAVIDAILTNAQG